jgi:hypothetical protein
MPEIAKKPSYEINESELTTFADIYRQWLILRLKLASTFANVIHDKLITLNIADGEDKEEKMSELKELSNIFLAIVGFRERWFYDFSKNTLANELGLYGGLTTHLLPEYLGDLIANLERYNIIKANKQTDLGAVLATALSLLGVRISPELLQNIVDLIKKELKLDTGNNQNNA